MTWPTCRTYPRSLAQAFPRDFADPIEHCARPWGLRDLIRAVVCVAAAALIGALAAQGV